MQHFDATALKQITFASSTTDGTAILFGYLDHGDKEHKFACPPEAVQQIISRLLAAAQHSATIRDRPVSGIVVRGHSVTDLKEQNGVGLTLYPTRQVGIPFALDLHLAQQISSDLALAISKVQPTPEKKRH